MEAGYFYSRSTDLYVAREPLKVDARVIKAASELKIDLKWDDEGRINYISFYEGLLLLRQLGATMPTIVDYWLIFQDAYEASDEAMIAQLQSNRYAEWLNTLFENKGYAIDNPNITKHGECYTYQGVQRNVQMPFGHPGWCNIEDIDYTSGLPHTVELNREKYATSWKYWSFCDYDYTAAAIRGWVTSVGKPSLDLGIPANAAYPALMLRECRKKLPQPPINLQILQQAETYITDYETVTRERAYDGFYSRRSAILRFFHEHGSKFQNYQEVRIYKIKERITEILGILRILAKRKKDVSALEQIDKVAFVISGIEQDDFTFDDFNLFVRSSRKRLQSAIAHRKPIVFVIGHKNPDIDAVVSALAEAYRNYLMDRHEKIYVPVVEGNRMPDEVKRLLGEELSESIVLSDETVYRESMHSGHARWIMVDHNKNREVQKFTISIVDHHVPCETALRQNISKTLEMMGSTTAHIVQKIHGLGVDIPTELARIFYGATLMDTENRIELKMTAKDVYIMDDLKMAAEVESDGELYQDLMGFLLNTDCTESLFWRDYKEDWAFFGFAVAKIKDAFDDEGKTRKQDLLDKLVLLAEQNNKEKNLPLTIIKLVDYRNDNETVNRERIYLVFNSGVFPEFKTKMFELVETIITHTFKRNISIIKTDDYIEFWGTGDQLSRKHTAPILEPVAVAYNEYFYSPSTELYVKRNFLTATAKVQEAAKRCSIELSWDEESRINYITYGEAMKLLTELGFTAMSLREYWRILQDTRDISDRQMIDHLQSDGFVEFLHTVIECSESVIEKPHILDRPGGFTYEGIYVATPYDYRGRKLPVYVPEGMPGLLHPKDIDLETGLPSIVHGPDIYNNPELWRYWSPDAEKNVASRGHIFLLGQPALDLKMHLSEAFHCLGVRPCCIMPELPEVNIIADGEDVSVVIQQGGETRRIRKSELLASVID